MFSLQNVGTFIQILSSFVAYILTVSPVGYFKAWITHRCGDDTARDEGLMTFDPLVHFDFIGLVALIFLGIGWGRNIPVNFGFFHEPHRRLKIAASLFASGIMHALLTCLAAIIWFIFFDSRTIGSIENYPLTVVFMRVIMSFVVLNSFLAVMTIFINLIVLISLLISERYAAIAQHIYNVILIAPLALILILELFGIHILGIMQTCILQGSFFIGKLIADLLGIR